MSGGPTSASKGRRALAAAGVLWLAGCASSSTPTAKATPLPGGRGWKVTALTHVAPREGTPVVANRLVWVPSMSGGSIIAVDVGDGRVVRTVRVGDPGNLLRQGCGTSSVHATPHGSFDIRRCDVPNALVFDGMSLWVTVNDGRALLRLDPVTGANLQTFALGVEGFGLAAGDSGVWVTDFQHDSVVHFGFGGGAVPQVTTITGLPPGPAGIAVGPDAVWVTCARAGSIVRIDPRTNSVVATVPLFKSPLAVTLAFGSAWARSEEGDVLTRIDPASNAVLANITVGAAEGLDGLDQFGVDSTGLWLGGLQVAHVSASTNSIDRRLTVDSEALDYGAGDLWAVGLLGNLTRIKVS